MNTKLVNSAAGVINAALASNRTAAGIALALDSAQLLMSPETAAELEQLRAQVAELEAQREVLVERLRAGQRWQRGRTPELVSENYVSQSELREIFGIALAAPWVDVSQDATGTKLTFTPVPAMPVGGEASC
ncbi:hypothetical protein ACIGMX_16115 [Streptomyces aquilus]|uniref:hypothetical protein n=1 Tax=Streptomyces aquilus TaxID=2548456 RepID=UPI0037D67130